MVREFDQIDWNEAAEDDCRQLVRLGVREELDRGHDWTTLALIPPDRHGTAMIASRQSGTVAGLRAAQIALDEMESQLELVALIGDGDPVCPGGEVARLSGSARSLLTCERLILNLVSRLSGIATLTRRYVDAVAGTGVGVCDTRKTTAGWRRLEKYAVRCGGGLNHRTGLFDAILIKDNHLAAARPDGILAPSQAVRTARQFVKTLSTVGPSTARKGEGMIVQVEVDTLDQLRDVLPAAPDIVLLDNMSLDQLRQAVAIRDQTTSEVELEASGSVNLETVTDIAATGVTRISVGALTHSAVTLDLGLDWLEVS